VRGEEAGGEGGGVGLDLECLRVRFDDDSAEQDGGFAEDYVEAELHRQGQVRESACRCICACTRVRVFSDNACNRMQLFLERVRVRREGFPVGG
jgi:hypothetical protein